MPKVTLSVQLPNGQTLTRTTSRTYTHVVYEELHYADGYVSYTAPEWCGRADLAAKASSRRVCNHERDLGSNYGRKWSQEQGWHDFGTLIKVVPWIIVVGL